MRKTILLLVSCMAVGGCALSDGSDRIPGCDSVDYPAPTPGTPPLVVDGRYFKDADGRIVWLRGVNAVGSAKVPDFMPITDAAMLDPLPGWGFNTLRLLFVWEGFEGTRCVYDESYLAYYQRVVDWAEARGLYVIVDFHQDAYARNALDGCGEGFPLWALPSDIPAAIPDNGPSCHDWGPRMAFDEQNKTLWKRFHQNHDGVRDAFLDMVEAVSHHLSGHPNVVGYDMLNEPWGSDEEIRSLLEDAASVIRQRHPNAILFAPAHALVSGLADNTMAKPDIANFAYAPHYYDPIVMMLEKYEGNDVGLRLDTHLRKAEEWGVPMFLGEFGANPNTTGGTAYIEAIYDWLDGSFISSAHWNYEPNWNATDKDGWNAEDFSIVDGGGTLRANFTPRPYPVKTAGVPLSFSLDEGGFSYRWTNAPAAGDAGTTEIFLPAGYGKDKILTVDSPSAGGCSVSGQTVTCQIADAGEVSVTLTQP